MMAPDKDIPVPKSLCDQRYGTMKTILITLLVIGVSGFVSVGAMGVRSKALVETMLRQMESMHGQQTEMVMQIGELTGEVRKLNGGE